MTRRKKVRDLFSTELLPANLVFYSRGGCHLCITQEHMDLRVGPGGSRSLIFAVDSNRDDGRISFESNLYRSWS
jgi:hypothetical protein